MHISASFAKNQTWEHLKNLKEKYFKRVFFRTNLWFLEHDLLNAGNNVISFSGIFSRISNCLQLLILKCLSGLVIWPVLPNISTFSTKKSLVAYKIQQVFWTNQVLFWEGENEARSSRATEVRWRWYKWPCWEGWQQNSLTERKDTSVRWQ